MYMYGNVNTWERGSISFVKRLFLLCPLLGGFFIGGSTVYAKVMEILLIHCGCGHYYLFPQVFLDLLRPVFILCYNWLP